MSRATWIASAIALFASGAAVMFYLQKRTLEDELADRPAAASAAPDDPWSSAPSSEHDDGPPARDVPQRKIDRNEADAPQLPDAPKETRAERRARRQQELAALLGRADGETDDEYRARILPLMQAALEGPRKDEADQRAQAEAAANVTPEQHKQLDAAIDQTYKDLIDYTNGAISDGELSPYQRNVSGMLDYAGGLGGMLQSTQDRFGKILSPEQQHAMGGSGFDWAEYLGVSAPWEQLNPPPPPPPGGGS